MCFQFHYRIPKLQVTGEGEEMEIQVSDNPFDNDPVDISNVPVIVTLTLVCKIILNNCDRNCFLQLFVL